jgi:hypothetical protein
MVLAVLSVGVGGILSHHMVLALSDFAATFGLVVVFFVVFPILVQGLIAFAAAQALGEKAENDEYAARHRTPGSRV